MLPKMAKQNFCAKAVRNIYLFFRGGNTMERNMTNRIVAFVIAVMMAILSIGFMPATVQAAEYDGNGYDNIADVPYEPEMDLPYAPDANDYYPEEDEYEEYQELPLGYMPIDPMSYVGIMPMIGGVNYSPFVTHIGMGTWANPGPTPLQGMGTWNVGTAGHRHLFPGEDYLLNFGIHGFNPNHTTFNANEVFHGAWMEVNVINMPSTTYYFGGRPAGANHNIGTSNWMFQTVNPNGFAQNTWVYSQNPFGGTVIARPGVTDTNTSFQTPDHNFYFTPHLPGVYRFEIRWHYVVSRTGMYNISTTSTPNWQPWTQWRLNTNTHTQLIDIHVSYPRLQRVNPFYRANYGFDALSLIHGHGLELEVRLVCSLDQPHDLRSLYNYNIVWDTTRTPVINVDPFTPGAGAQNMSGILPTPRNEVIHIQAHGQSVTVFSAQLQRVRTAASVLYPASPRNPGFYFVENIPGQNRCPFGHRPSPYGNALPFGGSHVTGQNAATIYFTVHPHANVLARGYAQHVIGPGGTLGLPQEAAAPGALPPPDHFEIPGLGFDNAAGRAQLSVTLEPHMGANAFILFHQGMTIHWTAYPEGIVALGNVGGGLGTDALLQNVTALATGDVVIRAEIRSSHFFCHCCNGIANNWNRYTLAQGSRDYVDYIEFHISVVPTGLEAVPVTGGNLNGQIVQYGTDETFEVRLQPILPPIPNQPTPRPNALPVGWYIEWDTPEYNVLQPFSVAPHVGNNTDSPVVHDGGSLNEKSLTVTARHPGVAQFRARLVNGHGVSTSENTVTFTNVTAKPRGVVISGWAGNVQVRDLMFGEVINPYVLLDPIQFNWNLTPNWNVVWHVHSNPGTPPVVALSNQRVTEGMGHGITMTARSAVTGTAVIYAQLRDNGGNVMDSVRFEINVGVALPNGITPAPSNPAYVRHNHNENLYVHLTPAFANLTSLPTGWSVQWTRGAGSNINAIGFASGGIVDANSVTTTVPFVELEALANGTTEITAQLRDLNGAPIGLPIIVGLIEAHPSGLINLGPALSPIDLPIGTDVILTMQLVSDLFLLLPSEILANNWTIGWHSDNTTHVTATPGPTDFTGTIAATNNVGHAYVYVTLYDHNGHEVDVVRIRVNVYDPANALVPLEIRRHANSPLNGLVVYAGNPITLEVELYPPGSNLYGGHYIFWERVSTPANSVFAWPPPLNNTTSNSLTAEIDAALLGHSVWRAELRLPNSLPVGTPAVYFNVESRPGGIANVTPLAFPIMAGQTLPIEVEASPASFAGHPLPMGWRVDWESGFAGITVTGDSPSLVSAITAGPLLGSGNVYAILRDSSNAEIHRVTFVVTIVPASPQGIEIVGQQNNRYIRATSPGERFEVRLEPNMMLGSDWAIEWTIDNASIRFANGQTSPYIGSTAVYLIAAQSGTANVTARLFNLNTNTAVVGTDRTFPGVLAKPGGLTHVAPDPANVQVFTLFNPQLFAVRLAPTTPFPGFTVVPTGWSVVWTSSNDAAISVAEAIPSGLMANVTPHFPSSHETITATLYEGTTQRGQVVFNVTIPVPLLPPTGLERVSGPTHDMLVHDTLDLAVEITPAGADLTAGGNDWHVTWAQTGGTGAVSVGTPSGAYGGNVTITATAPGTALVSAQLRATATSLPSYTISFTITIDELGLTNVTQNPRTLIYGMHFAEQGRFEVELTPAGFELPPNWSIEWTTSDPSVVTIWTTNNLFEYATTQGLGPAQITATLHRNGVAVTGANASFTWTVDVEEATPTGLARIGIQDREVAVGDTYDLYDYVNYLPLGLVNAPLPTGWVVSWWSSDTDVATVNSAGVVTGVTPGLALVVARLYYQGNTDMSWSYASFWVTVYDGTPPPPLALVFDLDSLESAGVWGQSILLDIVSHEFLPAPVNGFMLIIIRSPGCPIYGPLTLVHHSLVLPNGNEIFLCASVGRIDVFLTDGHPGFLGGTGTIHAHGYWDR